jgi:predicted molibdopterin-dependent oxidoreductase YjgC
MPDTVRLLVNGRAVSVTAGATVAAAVLASGEPAFRRSVTGEPRGPVCGMGICFECRVTIDGRAHVRGCQVVCRDGMDIRTDG